jgi:hypothetical protein
MAENKEKNAGMHEEKHEFKQIEIRLKVKESEPLYSAEPVTCVDNAVKLLSDLMKDMDRECVYIINLDSKMHPLSFNLSSVGGMNYAPVDPANIFKSAILTNASNVIILHVHPSGDYTPSRADIEVTQRVALSGAVMGIPLQDHIIVAGGTGNTLSLKNEMPDLFRDTTRLAEERAAQVPVVAEAAPAVYSPVQNSEQEKTHEQPISPTGNIYNEVMMVIRRGQEIEKTTPEAWQLSYEVAEVWAAHNGKGLSDQDYEMQKFIVENAESIVKGETDSIRGGLTAMADKSEDISFVKKAFHLAISIEHYAEKPRAAIKDAVKAEANIEKTIEKTDNKDENAPRSFKDILDQNDSRAEAINAARQATMMAQSKDQKAQTL